MSKKKRKQEESGGAGWIATYADTVTLLLTFFILLYSMSTVDVQKMAQLSEAFQMMMTGKKGETMLQYDLYNGKVPLIGGESEIEENIDEIESEDYMYFHVEKFVQEHDLEEVVEIVNSDRGIVIQLRENVLFETSSSALRQDSKEILKKISSLLGNLSNSIIVEGHTDNRPINTSQFPSNWELSVDRAVNVVRYFIEDMGLNPTRFTAAGYGEFQPIVPNDSVSNMAKNRRVNILIMAIDEE